MCSTCGCGSSGVTIDNVPMNEHTHTHEHTHNGHTHSHAHHHGHDHHHDHPHDHTHPHDHDHDHPHDHTHPHDDAARTVLVERNLLEKNNAIARENRQHFQDHAIFALNLVSSPGSGKTTLLVKTIEAIQSQATCAVIEGDQQTQNDAARIRKTGVPAVQINTGKGCHLDAQMVARALGNLPEMDRALLFIENVGNLVCPAGFDLGEAHKVAILSVTEGSDKPQKYPDMFHAASLMIINKIDLLPYVDFNVEEAVTHAKNVNPSIQVLRVSATTGEGMDQWLDWITAGQKEVCDQRDQDLQHLRDEIAALKAQLASRS
ncbi:MAG: hydrogenase nickel incorporation protein HypB [Burkholderiales bacterium]|jgi:hydrogenase nickel incorporation protein HypB|nr:hydrogenase nickel incorporation protein HypB [Burkholderiales bacterium]